MRIAGDVDFEVRSIDDISRAFDAVADLARAAIPAESDKPFSLKIVFDAGKA